ncbi:MAG: aminoglycoside/choline kinase family phosphotransferase [Flavobacterium sp.]
MIEENKAIRMKALGRWASSKLKNNGVSLNSELELCIASDDASFRKYYRAKDPEGGATGIIFVDAPPQHENNEAFIDIANLISKQGLSAPAVLDYDLNEGFMMLSDFGNKLYLDELEAGDSSSITKLYKSALASLSALQGICCTNLPAYDEELLRVEMQLFPNWFLSKQINMTIDQDVSNLMESTFDLMVKNALEQPQVFVHRDYHSRNLMVLDQNTPGLIDFQDAVKGPFTYDLVSLLKDCYWQFPREQVVEWVKVYWKAYLLEGNLEDNLKVDFAQFLRWFDLMGMQRHLKVAGIFSRLNIRDGKSRYLNDIPLVMSYLLEVCEIYEELGCFGKWLREEVQPRCAKI